MIFKNKKQGRHEQCFQFLELGSKRPETRDNWRAGSQKTSGRGRGLGAAQASDPRPAQRPFEAALAAQTTDDTRREAAIYTLRRASESVTASGEKEGGKNVPNVQQQKTRKESVTADFDLVTIVTYSNFSTHTSPTSQPQPDFQDCESRHSWNFIPETFFFFSRADLPLRNEQKPGSLHSPSC